MHHFFGHTVDCLANRGQLEGENIGMHYLEEKIDYRSFLLYIIVLSQDSAQKNQVNYTKMEGMVAIVPMSAI